jgi:hypothetical protein
MTTAEKRMRRIQREVAAEADAAGYRWYATKGSMGQGLVIEEHTGRNVAVAYDEKDTPLIAASPDMLEACREVVAWECGDLAHAARRCARAVRIAETGKE